MKFDAAKLLTASTLPKVQGNLKTLTQFINDDPDWQDLRHIAYFLATTQHETAGTFAPIKEYRAAYGGKGRANQDRYWLTGYYGRGYVQITWERNYRKLGRRIGVGDLLVREPNRALDPEIAYKIAAVGMREGLFTGVDLDDFIDGERCDYLNARRVINGKDKADHIAQLARGWERILRAAQVEDSDVLELDAPIPPMPGPVTEEAPQSQPPPPPLASSPAEATTEKAADLFSIDGLAEAATKIIKHRDTIKSFRTLISMAGFGSAIAAAGAYFKDNPQLYYLLFVGIAIIAIFAWKYMTRQEKIAVERIRKQ